MFCWDKGYLVCYGRFDGPSGLKSPTGFWWNHSFLPVEVDVGTTRCVLVSCCSHVESVRGYICRDYYVSVDILLAREQSSRTWCDVWFPFRDYTLCTIHRLVGEIYVFECIEWWQLVLGLRILSPLLIFWAWMTASSSGWLFLSMWGWSTRLKYWPCRFLDFNCSFFVSVLFRFILYFRSFLLRVEICWISRLSSWQYAWAMAWIDFAPRVSCQLDTRLR